MAPSLDGMRKRRTAVLLLVALAFVLGAAAAVVVYKDRQTCPPGPWAHPLKRLSGQTYYFACAASAEQIAP